MHTPTVDILVPVWNNPFETRACLAAILEYSPEARLMVFDYGSGRETQLMLDDFAESLDDRGLFMTSDRNIGLISAINRGLASSDADYTVIVRPNVTVSKGWLSRLLEATASPGTGIVSPVFRGKGAPPVARPVTACPLMETFSVSLTTLMISGEARQRLGGFDEDMDGADWCLRDYLRRAEAAGFRVCVSAAPEMECTPETLFGSPERRGELDRISRERCRQRWGITHHYCVYFGPGTDTGGMSGNLEAITAGARKGDRFTLLLHRRQYREFRKRGWNVLHTAVDVRPLPLFGTMRSLARQVAELRGADPDLILVAGNEAAEFPGAASALKLKDVTAVQRGDESSVAAWNNPLEVV